MSTRHLVSVCGTAIALAVAPAFAQQSQTGDRTNTTSTTRSTTTMRMSGVAQDTESLLRDMEGLWRVEVAINQDLWSGKHGMSSDRLNDPGMRTTTGTGTTGSDTGRTRTGDDNLTNTGTNTGSDSARTGRTDDKAGLSGTDSSQTGRDQDRGQSGLNQDRTGATGLDSTRTGLSGQDSTTGMTGSLAGSKTFTGYAERKLVLGDNVLHETIVIPDMDMSAMKGHDMGAAAMGSGSEKGFKGMSMISFDKDSDTYSIVFCDNRTGKMHYDTGSFDASGGRLVFHGESDKFDGMRGYQNNEHNAYIDRDPAQNTTGADRDTTGLDRSTTGNDSGRTRTGDDNLTNPGTNTGSDRTRTGTTGTTGTTTSRTGQSERGEWTSGATTTTLGSGRLGGSGMGSDQVKVVVEVIDNNTHRVTMYKADGMGSSGATGATGDSGVRNWWEDPSRTNTNTDTNNTTGTGSDRTGTGTGTGTGQAGDRTGTGTTGTSATGTTGTTGTTGQSGLSGTSTTGLTSSTSSLDGQIIYQATYTRVQGSEVDRIRQMIEEPSTTSQLRNDRNP